MTKFFDQSIKFFIVGAVSNLILYLIYVALTKIGFDYKVAMTMLFALGAMNTFIFNRRWTFNFKGALAYSLLKYLIVYFFAYVVNLIFLIIFVDYFNYPHELIQGLMITILAMVLFLVQRYWVFGG